jgi:hypothetical protein
VDNPLRLDKPQSLVNCVTADAQDAPAAAILQEVASEEHWTAAFARHSDAPAALADEALRELHAGETQPLDP